MGFKYLGLICLLVGIAACFGLWLHAISNRSKTVEIDAAPAEPQPVPEAQLSQGMYSLAPNPKKVAGAPSEPLAQASSRDQELESSLERGQLKPPTEEAQDETASNHLELANHFFIMADFEGTVEMCQMVLDNSQASALQISSAQELISRC